MYRSMIRAMVQLESGRWVPLFAVTLLLVFAGVILVAMPGEELAKIGFTLLYYMPVVFALILGADVAARDREQNTQVSVSALPVPPLLTFMVRSMSRLLLAFLFWAGISLLIHYVLTPMMPAIIPDLITSFNERMMDGYIIGNLELLILFSYFAGAVGSVFAPDSLSAIGLSAAILIIGSGIGQQFGVTTRWEVILGLALITAVLAMAAAWVYASRRPWTVQAQARILFIALGVIGIIILTL